VQQVGIDSLSIVAWQIYNIKIKNDLQEVGLGGGGGRGPVCVGLKIERGRGKR